mgnify:CR=1 FL=1
MVNEKLRLGYVKFESPVRHSGTNVFQEVGYLGLEIRESYKLVV